MSLNKTPINKKAAKELNPNVVLHRALLFFSWRVGHMAFTTQLLFVLESAELSLLPPAAAAARRYCRRRCLPPLLLLPISHKRGKRSNSANRMSTCLSGVNRTSGRCKRKVRQLRERER